MKYVIIFLLSTTTVFSQEINLDSVPNKPKSYGEISFEFIVAPGYAYIWNIKDKLNIMIKQFDFDGI